jgi:hypothetical protein
VKLRDRMIYAGIVTSDMKRRHKVHVREFYRDLLHCCDDHGRFEADPALLRAVLYSSILDRVSVRDVQGYLQALHVAGDVKLYTVRGRGYGKVTKWRQKRLTRLVAEYPDEEGDEPLLSLTAADPPAPPRVEPPPRKEGKKEVSGRAREAGDTHDTRLAELCLPEIAARWPKHDVAACLRDATRYVRKRSGECAMVTAGWFEKHWLPGAAEAKPKPAEPPRKEPEAGHDYEATRRYWLEQPEPPKDSFQHVMWTEARRTA